MAVKDLNSKVDLTTYNSKVTELTNSINAKASKDVASTSVNGLMSSADKTKLDGIATGANAYTHPTTSGNKHIPSGGASGQILRWSADGTAVWGADNNTTYSAGSGLTLSGTTFAANIGTGSTQVAAGNHTHSYLPLTGGTLTSNLTIDKTGNAWAALTTKNTINSKNYHFTFAADSYNNKGSLSIVTKNTTDNVQRILTISPDENFLKWGGDVNFGGTAEIGGSLKVNGKVTSTESVIGSEDDYTSLHLYNSGQRRFLMRAVKAGGTELHTYGTDGAWESNIVIKGGTLETSNAILLSEGKPIYQWVGSTKYTLAGYAANYFRFGHTSIPAAIQSSQYINAKIGENFYRMALMNVGTAAPTATTCPQSCIYGQY